MQYGSFAMSVKKNEFKPKLDNFILKEKLSKLDDLLRVKKKYFHSDLY